MTAPPISREFSPRTCALENARVPWDPKETAAAWRVLRGSACSGAGNGGYPDRAWREPFRSAVLAAVTSALQSEDECLRREPRGSGEHAVPECVWHSC